MQANKTQPRTRIKKNAAGLQHVRTAAAELFLHRQTGFLLIGKLPAGAPLPDLQEILSAVIFPRTIRHRA